MDDAERYPIDQRKKNIYGKVNIVEARPPSYLRGAYQFLKPEDERAEREKDK